MSCRKHVAICIVLITSVFVTGTIATVITFFPTNNFIEESVTALTSIYNGAIVLIGGLLAYKIGLFYFGSSLSISGALEKVMDQMNTPPFNPFNPIQMNEWNELTDEGKLARVMKALIYKETCVSRYHDDFFLELGRAEPQNMNDGESEAQFPPHNINALTLCVNRKLTHVIRTTLTQPHMPEDFRANVAFIDPLANALSGAVTEAAGSSPREEGWIIARIKIDIFNLTVALTSALILTLTEIGRENEKAIQNHQGNGDLEGNELKERVKGILVDALNHNSSSPTLNYYHLKAIIRRALIPHNEGCTNRGSGAFTCETFSCCCPRRNRSERNNYNELSGSNNHTVNN